MKAPYACSSEPVNVYENPSGVASEECAPSRESMSLLNSCNKSNEAPSKASNTLNHGFTDIVSGDLCHTTSSEDEEDVSRQINVKKPWQGWLGVAIIALLNFMSAWSIIMYAPIADITRRHFQLDSLTPINWLYICATFVYFAVSPISYLVTHKNTKAALVLGAGCLVLGSWLRYLGTKFSSYPCLFVGSLLCGASQPFALNIPSHYSYLWFEPHKRVTPTALMSLANPLGQAIGTLVVPFLATDTASVTSMTLYIAILFTATVWTAIIAPGRPHALQPRSSTRIALSMRKSMQLLLHRKEFFLLFVPFTVYVAAFNAFASLTQQFVQPYGFSDIQAGIIGAATIVIGLLAGGLSAPYLDKTGAYQWPIRICVVLSATCYFALIFVIREYTIGVFVGILILAGCIGAASLVLLPVVLELASDVTAPVSPELASSVLWAGGQGLAGIVILIIDKLRSTDLKYTHGLIFLIVLTLAPVPFALLLSTSAEAKRCRAQARGDVH